MGCWHHHLARNRSSVSCGEGGWRIGLSFIRRLLRCRCSARDCFGVNGAAKSGNRSENLFARASWYEVGRSSDGSPRSSWAVGFVIWHLQRNRALSPGKPVALLATLSCSRRCDTMVLAQASDWVIGLVEPTQGPPVFQMSLHQRCLSVNSALACAWPPRRGRRVQRGRPLTHGW